MQPSLLTQGIELMIAGMGVVFVFLTLLVGVVTLMSRLLARFFPEPEPVATPSRRRADVPATHLKAIQKALDLHRKRSRND